MSDPGQSPCVDDVIITGELARRPSRAPDYEAESAAFRDLAETMATEPDKELQRLVGVVMELTRADTGGISLPAASAYLSPAASTASCAGWQRRAPMPST